jgi:hypothetical protein
VRTAAVVGTATAVNGRVQRRQAARYGETAYAEPAVPQQAAPQEMAAPPEPAPDRLAQLAQLGELKAQGVLSEEEFAREKAKILGT